MHNHRIYHIPRNIYTLQSLQGQLVGFHFFTNLLKLFSESTLFIEVGRIFQTIGP